MGNDDKREDTPPTGTAVPRPMRRAEPPPPSEPPVDVSLPPPPMNPTVADIYNLIDSRLSPKIIERISSVPPKAEAPRRDSMPVRAAKVGSKWTAFVLAGITFLGQGLALWAAPEYRGPIVQTAKLIAVVVSKAMADNPDAPPDTDTPELLPAPASPLLLPEVK